MGPCIFLSVLDVGMLLSFESMRSTIIRHRAEQWFFYTWSFFIPACGLVVMFGMYYALLCLSSFFRILPIAQDCINIMVIMHISTFTKCHLVYPRLITAFLHFFHHQYPAPAISTPSRQYQTPVNHTIELNLPYKS